MQKNMNWEDIVGKHQSEIMLREKFALECHSAILNYIGPFSGAQPEKLAKLAIQHADALIKELAA